MMGHLNSFSASGVGNLNKNFTKIQMPGGLPGGMFKVQSVTFNTSERPSVNSMNALGNTDVLS